MSSSVHSRWGRGGWNHLHRCAQTTSQHPQQVTGENALDLNGFHEHNTLQMYSKYVKYKRINKRRPEEEVSDRFSLLQSKSVSRSQCVKAGTEEKLVLHLLLHRRLPRHLPLLHFHPEGPGDPHRQVGHQGVLVPPLCWVGRGWLCCVVMLCYVGCGVVLCSVGFLCPHEDNEDRTGVRSRKGWFVA